MAGTAATLMFTAHESNRARNDAKRKEEDQLKRMELDAAERKKLHAEEMNELSKHQPGPTAMGATSRMALERQYLNRRANPTERRSRSMVG